MKYVYLTFVMFLITGCMTRDEAEQHRVNQIVNQQMNQFKQSCEPAYKLARTHSDSMVVHVSRTTNGFSGLTCLEVLNRISH